MVPLLLVSVNLVLWSIYSDDRALINKCFSLFLQLIGGGSILYSIDSNFEAFQKGNMISAFKKYWKECPIFKQHYYLNAEPAIIKTKMGMANSRLVRNPKTVEETLAYLQEQIDHFDVLIRANEVAIEKKCGELKDMIEKQANELNTVSKRAEKRIEDIVLGGVNAQIFGLFLLVHGAIAGFFA